MARILLALVVAVFPAWAAVAQQSMSKPKRSESAALPKPAKSAACAQYGPGFVKVEGSSTCVKIGGYISVEGTVNSGR